MDIGVNATKILNRLELFDVLRIVALLVGARFVSFLLRWIIRHLAESGPLRWRLTILKLMPMARLLVVFAALAIIVPIVIRPTFENVVTLVAAGGLALAFALKDFASSVIAGLVTVVEGLYQPGDWIEVDGAYGEVTVVGLRALRLVTLDDTEVIIPHTKLWSSSISNATGGNHHLLCVTSFYLDPQHDAAQVRRGLEAVVAESPYHWSESPIKVVLQEEPWGTHYKVKAYVRESRDQVAFTSDVTVRGKAMLQEIGVKAAHALVAGKGP